MVDTVMQVYRGGGSHGESVEAGISSVQYCVQDLPIKREQKVHICCLTLTLGDDWSTVICFPLMTAMHQYSTGLCVIYATTVMMMHTMLK